MLHLAHDARLSRYEPLGLAKTFQGKLDRVWLDCFDGKPWWQEGLEEMGFKICLVSPELQGHPIESISQFRSMFPYLEEVCTKQPEY